ncbi:longitudinals lacking protein, isoforms N/O/W/X/Y-like isoform X2 [Musca autumnalis]|uniref:longitudinals lacking protein, isoforms N/O/W/X/Y-like isoform X2 n=1 Tax=Musca autumnalis TaxID=221902 RepID=UPI003CF9643A
MDDDQQFCLRWNNHQSTLISVFDTLLENETLVDCTLAAEGKFLKAHKVVLSACSPYFATLLQEQYDKHPIFILKDVKYQELRAMMDYMYRGEVNISQDQLGALLKAAESLQIKGLSDNRSGGGASQPKHPEHHRPTMAGKLSGGYTLEQTKRARITGAAGPAMDASEMGSREGSSSPSRRRRKVRRRSIENAMTDVHDNSNSSQQPTQSNAPGLGAITAAASALAAAAAGAPPSAAAAAAALASTVVPLSATQQQQSSSSAVTSAAPGTTLSSSKKTDNVKGSTQQQQQQDAINTDNVQGSAAGSMATATPAMDTESATDASTADKSNHKQQQQQQQSKTTTSKDTSSVTGSELVIEPKAEYDDEANDETVEDLTLDEEDMGMDDLDHNAGTSQGGEGSSQGYAPWQHDRSQDELLLATQEAQQRDPQASSSTESYWTIVETVPYSLASSQTNTGTTTCTNVISSHQHGGVHQQQQQQHQQQVHQHHQHHNTTTILQAHPHSHHQASQATQQSVVSSTPQHVTHTTSSDPADIIASATVVVEIPSETEGMPASTIHYTLPKGTTTQHQEILRSVQTSTALTAAYNKLANPPAATIQIVKQEATTNNLQQSGSGTTRAIIQHETHGGHVQHHHQQQQQHHHQVQHITLQECLEATATTAALQQQQQQQQQHATQHLHVTTSSNNNNNNTNNNITTTTQLPQTEFIKIDTSRFEDKVLLRNVVQYEQQQQQQIATHNPHGPPTATIIVNETTGATHLEVIKDHHQHHQSQHHHHGQQQHQQHHAQLQAISESVTTTSTTSETDDLEGELTEMKSYNNLQNPPPQSTTTTTTSGHETSENESDKFLAPPKRIKTIGLKPSDIAAAGLQYVCNVCGKSYKIKGSLKRHKSYECGVAPQLSCPYCPHKCKYKSDLRKHISQKHAVSVQQSSAMYK